MSEPVIEELFNKEELDELADVNKPRKLLGWAYHCWECNKEGYLLYLPSGPGPNNRRGSPPVLSNELPAASLARNNSFVL